MKSFSLVLLSVLAMGACGGDDGGSGIDSSKQLKDLTVAEAMTLCHSLADTFPERMVTCMGQTATFGLNDADCSSSSGSPTEGLPATCTVTVGEAETCFKDLSKITDSQICAGNFTLPASCNGLNSSACDSGGGSGSAVAPEGMHDRVLWLMERARMVAGH